MGRQFVFSTSEHVQSMGASHSDQQQQDRGLGQMQISGSSSESVALKIHWRLLIESREKASRESLPKRGEPSLVYIKSIHVKSHMQCDLIISFRKVETGISEVYGPASPANPLTPGPKDGCYLKKQGRRRQGMIPEGGLWILFTCTCASP